MKRLPPSNLKAVRSACSCGHQHNAAHLPGLEAVPPCLHCAPIQELEKRFYSGSSSAEAGKAAKAAAADFAVLAGFLSQRGWATLAVPSSNSSSGGTGGVKLTEADYRELDSQLDEVSMPLSVTLQLCW